MRSVCRDALVVMEYVLTQTFTFAAELHVVNLSVGLHYALSHHGVCHLHKASNIGPFHIISVSIWFLAILYTLLVYRMHDVSQPRVNLISRP